MHRFYIEEFLEKNKVILLTKKICLHIQVLRLKNQEEIILFNGDGYSYLAKINIIGKQKIEAYINDLFLPKNYPALNIHLIQSICASNKMDWVIQKSVELGVTKIYPVVSNRSNYKLKQKDNNKWDRWREIILSSCEQCGCNFIPELEEVKSLEDLLFEIKQQQQNNLLLLSTQESHSIKDISIDLENNNIITIMVGPEGGFTKEEELLAMDTLFTPIHLGNRIMRTETASLAVVSCLQLLYGDF